MRTFPRVCFSLLAWIISSEAKDPSEKRCHLVTTGEKCVALYYRECTSELLTNQYPSLYFNPENVTIAAPNLTIATEKKEDHDGPYTQANVTIYSANETEERIQGFEVRLTSIVGTRCVIVTPGHYGTLTLDERNSGFSFNLELSKSINISAWSLPKSPASRSAERFVLAGEITNEFPLENSSLWFTKIWFINNSRDRTVEVQFQPAPASYGIQYYNIQLRQIKQIRDWGLSSRTTTHAKMEFSQTSAIRVKFKNVEPGTYRVMVEAYDDLAGEDSKCRCKKFGKCSPCTPAETPTFVMEDTRPIVTSPEVNTGPELITSKSYDIIEVFNSQTNLTHPMLFPLKESKPPILNSKFSILRTDHIMSTENEMKSAISSSKSPELLHDNISLGEDFESGTGRDSGSADDDGSSWQVSVITLSGLAVMIGALVSAFVVLSNRRKGQPSYSISSVTTPKGSNPDILIVHDAEHSSQTQDLLTQISQLQVKDITAGARPNSPKNLSMLFRSHSTVIILWMTQSNFTDFERRLLEDKDFPLSTIQKRFVIIESQAEGCSIQPQIQYRMKFSLNDDLDVFLNFLRSDFTPEPRNTWSALPQPMTDTKITTQALNRFYSRMDSGIHSDFENEVESNSLEYDVIEKQSMAAVTIAEGHLDAPPPRLLNACAPNQFLLPCLTVQDENHAMPYGSNENYNANWLHDDMNHFLPPDVMSNFDVEGSVLSEAIMHFNERNDHQSEASKHRPFSFTNGRTAVPPVLTRNETPVFYQMEDEEEGQDDLPAGRHDDSLERGDVSSVGGLSC